MESISDYEFKNYTLQLATSVARFDQYDSIE